MLDEELEEEDGGLGTASIPVKYMAAPEVKAEVKAEVETEVEAEVETEVEAEVKAEVKADVYQELAQDEQTVAGLENLIRIKEQEIE